MAKQTKNVTAGTEVHLVLCSGGHLPAKVTKVHGGGEKVDLEAVHNGAPLVITGSPLDESGKLADSWHWSESEAKESEPPAKAQ